MDVPRRRRSVYDVGTTGTGTVANSAQTSSRAGDEFAGPGDGFPRGARGRVRGVRRRSFRVVGYEPSRCVRGGVARAAATAAAVTRRRRRAARAQRRQRRPANPAADVASFGADARIASSPRSFGAAGAADAGFSFDAFAAKDDDVEREDERGDDDAGVSDEDDDVVDVGDVGSVRRVGRSTPARATTSRRPPPTNPTRIRGDA